MISQEELQHRLSTVGSKPEFRPHKRDLRKKQTRKHDLPANYTPVPPETYNEKKDGPDAKMANSRIEYARNENFTYGIPIVAHWHGCFPAKKECVWCSK
jgi:hypothetical protein